MATTVDRSVGMIINVILSVENVVVPLHNPESPPYFVQCLQSSGRRKSRTLDFALETWTSFIDWNDCIKPHRWHTLIQ